MTVKIEEEVIITLQYLIKDTLNEVEKLNKIFNSLDQGRSISQDE